MAAGYMIANLDVTDPERFKTYQGQVPKTIAAFDGGYLVRGGRWEKLEGQDPLSRLVIVRFPSIERALEWYNSPAYEAPKALRQSASAGNLFLAEGVDAEVAEAPAGAGYILVIETVHDQAAYQAYGAKARPTVAARGGVGLVRGGRTVPLEGEPPLPLVILLRFDSYEKALGWYHSPEYAGPMKERHACADANLLVIEGV